jgi:hypothetical protein
MVGTQEVETGRPPPSYRTSLDADTTRLAPSAINMRMSWEGLARPHVEANRER